MPPLAQRTIGLFRTSDSYIVQSRGWLPNALGGLIWFGAHAAPCTAYVPLAAGMAALPSVTLGHPAALDKSSLFWATRFVANIARLKHAKMYPEIQAAQATLHKHGLHAVATSAPFSTSDIDRGGSEKMRRWHTTMKQCLRASFIPDLS